MKFFLDSADIKEIRFFSESGLIDGVTTNPSIIAKSGKNFQILLKEICNITNGPVSAEIISEDFNNMLKEAEMISKIADNIVIKLPVTLDGIRACKYLTSTIGISVNLTLCFSATQAILAAKAGASYISPFIGRLDDIGLSGMKLVDDICQIYKSYINFNTEVLVASVRSPLHVVQAAKLGAHIVTVNPKIMHQLFEHPLTDVGLKIFSSDWNKTNQKI